MSKYSKSFKEEAVRVALTSAQSISQTARDLGIKENTLYNWISVAKNKPYESANQNGSKVNLVEELGESTLVTSPNVARRTVRERLRSYSSRYPIGDPRPNFQ